MVAYHIENLILKEAIWNSNVIYKSKFLLDIYRGNYQIVLSDLAQWLMSVISATWQETDTCQGKPGQKS
jgi:hypothetical protein